MGDEYRAQYHLRLRLNLRLGIDTTHPGASTLTTFYSNGVLNRVLRTLVYVYAYAGTLEEGLRGGGIVINARDVTLLQSRDVTLQYLLVGLKSQNLDFLSRTIVQFRLHPTIAHILRQLSLHFQLLKRMEYW